MKEILRYIILYIYIYIVGITNSHRLKTNPTQNKTFTIEL